VPAAGIEIQEIDDVAVNQAVGHVSRSPAEDQGKPEPAFAVPDDQNSDHPNGYRRCSDKKHIPQTLEHAEGRARVADIDNTEKGEYVHRFEQCKAAGDQILRRLIDNENNERHEKKRGISSFHFRTPATAQE
jgi:hypothetical protein